tara:strand:+ start:903 stop:1559 length:657 start_codon:yes stop_codon:yes gene_type:complete
MSRIFQLTIFLFSIIFSSSSLFASQSKHYAGLGFNMLNVDYGKENLDLSTGNHVVDYEKYAEKSFSNISIFYGYNFDQDYSMELEFFKDSATKSNNNTGLVWLSSGNPLKTRNKSEVTNISIDFYKHINVSSNDDIALSGLIGLSSYKQEDTTTYIDGQSESSFVGDEKGHSFNIGGQAKYQIQDNLFLRAKVKYSFLKGFDNIDTYQTFNLGIGYSF